jgi:PadR family transcriptional regulator, regulatory protein PadR
MTWAPLYRISMAKRDIFSAPLRPVAAKRPRVARNSAPVASANEDHRDLYTGLIRLHVLHHAVKESVYGFAMIEELRRHGYELSAGTLYPILHGLEKKGLLTSTRKRDSDTGRRIYRATPKGRKALVAAKAKVRELFGELFEDEGGG